MADEKEATVLDLSLRVNSELVSLRIKLDESFDRNPKEAKAGGTVEPVNPNVLDDVIENLQLAEKRVADMHEFLLRQAVLKIHTP